MAVARDKIQCEMETVTTIARLTLDAITFGWLILRRQVLGIVYRVIATHLTKKAGYSRKAAYTGAVTLIQRFGGALNLEKQP